MSEFEDGYRLMSRRTHDRNVSGEFYHHIAPVHQGTRATLKPLSWRAAYRQIIPRHSRVRTFDGYLFLIKRLSLDRYQRVVLTGMAQRQRAGLITLRSLDRNGLPVILHFGRFTEAALAPLAQLD